MPGGSPEYQPRAPEFYVSPAVDAEVAAALRTLWPWFWDYVGRHLGDSTRAGDINDKVADQVSDYVRRKPGHVRSLVSFCRAAAVNAVSSARERDRRIVYWGLSRDLEVWGRHAADSVEELEYSIWVDQILDSEDPELQAMLALRVAGKPWDWVGKALGLTGGQARLRFYRGLKRICGDEGDRR